MARKKRAGAYVRVSTDEQKKYGFSIQAQIEALKEWCEQNGYYLVEIYADEGFTAGNMKRPRLNDMLLELDRFDVIIFTKLDRLTRNVFEANDMLRTFEAHNVGLVSTQEDDIDTSTGDGKFMFDLKVSLAERELRKGSERIRAVFDYKVKNGLVINGNPPYGYTITEKEGKKVIGFDPEAEHIIRDIFEHFKKYHSVKKTMQDMNIKHDLTKSYQTYHRVLTNPFYYGKYKDNESYSPAYITKDQYLKNQVIIKNNIRQRHTKHVHIFTGRVKCPECGSPMAGMVTKRPNKTYYSYRCNKNGMQGRCSWNRVLNEDKVHDFLAKNVDRLAQEHMVNVEVAPVKKDNSQKRIREIQQEMENMTYSFNKGRMKVADYDRDYEALEQELRDLERNAPQQIDLGAIKEFLDSGWQNVYEDMSRENKQALWQNLIKEVILDKSNKVKDIIFL